MKKVIVEAPANIAFIKYWGKRDSSLNLPCNDSISMNLSEAKTTTSVQFDPALLHDEVVKNGKNLQANEAEKIRKHLDLMRSIAESSLFAYVETMNSFPSASGIASSASGFAALTLAASQALGLTLTEKELSILARKGSGSASRSIPDGFVVWHAEDDDNSSFSESLYPTSHWDIHDLVIVLNNASEKKMSSSAGHKAALKSPFFVARQEYLPQIMPSFYSALRDKDFSRFGEIIERDSLNMHAVMMTSDPSLLYWSDHTVTSMQMVQELRNQGVECYITLDAGPHPHIICESDVVEKIKQAFMNTNFVERIIDNVAAVGARVIQSSE